MPPTRRSYLGLFTVSAAGALAGCTDAVSSSGAATTTAEIPESAQPARCRGDAVTGSRTVHDPAGYEDGIEYDAENRSVRYQATGGGGSAEFETVSLEEWGEYETTAIAAERAASVAGRRLGTAEFSSSVSRFPDATAPVELVAMLTLTTRMRDGEVVERPDTPLSVLVDAAPRAVDATLSIKGDEVSRTVPVFADAVTSSPL